MADHIATITLNGPETVNAQNMPLLDDLDEARRRAADVKDVKVIVLQADGMAFEAIVIDEPVVRTGRRPR